MVVPTETVYGIACAPEHIEALYCAKERDRGKPVARLPASLDQVEALGADFDRPIALTSANKSGGADPTNAQDAFQCLETAVPLFLDSGETDTKVPSTVLLCTADETKVLRERAISSADVKAATLASS